MSDKTIPEGATHIDKENEYWSVVSPSECYFFRNYDWVRYIFTLEGALNKDELSPI